MYRREVLSEAIGRVLDFYEAVVPTDVKVLQNILKEKGIHPKIKDRIKGAVRLLLKGDYKKIRDFMELTSGGFMMPIGDKFASGKDKDAWSRMQGIMKDWLASNKPAKKGGAVVSEKTLVALAKAMAKLLRPKLVASKVYNAMVNDPKQLGRGFKSAAGNLIFIHGYPKQISSILNRLNVDQQKKVTAPLLVLGGLERGLNNLSSFNIGSLDKVIKDFSLESKKVLNTPVGVPYKNVFDNVLKGLERYKKGK